LARRITPRGPREAPADIDERIRHAQARLVEYRSRVWEATGTEFGKHPEMAAAYEAHRAAHDADFRERVNRGDLADPAVRVALMEAAEAALVVAEEVFGPLAELRAATSISAAEMGLGR
jgi:hypothetical protein